MKSSCTSCGKLIEYEAPSAGLDVACPHCGKVTKLAAYSVPPPIPQAVHTQSRAKRNSTLVVVLLIGGGVFVAVALFGLLAALAIPNFLKAKHKSQRAACLVNLKMIADAKTSWALENKKLETDVPGDADLFGRYIADKPACPAGGIYSLNPVREKPTCTMTRHGL